VGLTEVEVHLNSVGDAVCRPQYLQALRDYFRPRADELCEDCRRRLEHNPLRILDCKREACHRIARGAPSSIAHLCQACAAHLDGVKRHFDLLRVPYVIDPFIVRGLDYYTRTAVEVYSGRLGAQNAMFGGGRYDGLAEQLGGPPTPGVGFGFGLDRLLLVAEGSGRVPSVDRSIEIMIVTFGEAARDQGVMLLDEVRRAGFRAEGDLLDRDPRAQLKHANRTGARFALVLGDDELTAGTVTVREMSSGAQTSVTRSQVTEVLALRFGRAGAARTPEGGSH
jgi:histidyl-tRNA synthetase